MNSLTICDLIRHKYKSNVTNKIQTNNQKQSEFELKYRGKTRFDVKYMNKFDINPIIFVKNFLANSRKGN